MRLNNRRVARAALLLAAALHASAATPWIELQPGVRYQELTVPAGGKPGFTRLEGPTVGVSFTNQLSIDRFTTNQILLNGSGVAAGDIDGDGWVDIYLCGLDNRNGLFRNLGNWKFEEITASAGVALPGVNSAGAALADMDGDGDLDLLVTTIGSGLLYFINDGRGVFKAATVQAGLRNTYGGTSLGIADFDADGDLDIYFATYRSTTLRDEPGTNFRMTISNGVPVIATIDGLPASAPKFEGRFQFDQASGRILEFGEPDLFFVNQGDGTLKRHDVAGPMFLDESGAPMPKLFEWGLSVMFRDLNGDGLPDIYLCNDFESPDRLWLNTGEGTFRLAPETTLRSTPKFSMGVDVADINRDGRDDLFVLDMLPRKHATWIRRSTKHGDAPTPGKPRERLQIFRNTLHLGRSDGTYAEIAQLAGVEASEWAWGAVFTDVDLDGYEDILITNGHGRDDMEWDAGIKMARQKRAAKLSRQQELDLRREIPPYTSPKVAFRNRGNLTFEEVGAQWGFGNSGVTQGICLADLDNDGDQDVIVSALNAPVEIFRNESAAPRVSVRLKGGGKNSRAIGARVTVRAPDLPAQSQVMIAGGRYLSSDDPMRGFATGKGARLDLEVRWPNGTLTTIPDARPNRAYEIIESAANRITKPAENAAKAAPLFTHAVEILSHQDTPSPFEPAQPFLPHTLDQGGPKAAWADLNHDGWDDLILSGVAGQVLLTNHQGKSFRSTADAPAPLPLATQLSLLAFGRVETNAERRPAHNPPVVAVTDMDGDGRLEAFVGGGALPGKYPVAAASMLLRENGGRWEPDAKAAQVLADVGLVRAACWSDLNNDGFPELILACEWDVLKFSPNHGGVLQAARALPGAEGKRGWWTSVLAADLDHDGRMDIVAGNWGSNTRHQAWREAPVRLWYPDMNEDETPDLLESRWVPEYQAHMPWRGLDTLGAAFPALRERFRTHAAFSTASISDILREAPKPPPFLEANWLETTLFLNSSNGFRLVPLPIEAQFAPVLSIAAADFDGDGFEDLFLAQNLFALPPETTRLDGGRGLLLLGHGAGEFRPMESSDSGIAIYGEQRACAVGDFNRDGRPDLIVAQTGAGTILLENVRAQQGIRLRLEGPRGNPNGLGARVQLVAGDRRITREARSGFSSQDSPTLIMPNLGAGAEWVVRWPGGTTTRGKVTGSEVVARFADGTHP